MGIAIVTGPLAKLSNFSESMLAKGKRPLPAAGASVIVPVPALSNVSRFRRNGLAMSLVAV